MEPVAQRSLHGQSVLVVEDDYLLANDLERALTRAGCRIVGPVATVGDAMRLIERVPIDLAILDVNLDGDTVYPVADALVARQIAYVFATGYDTSALPRRHAGAPYCTKPVGLTEIVETLFARATPHPTEVAIPDPEAAPGTGL